MKKRGIFFLLIVINILFLISFVKADDFSIIWGIPGQEATIGGSGINAPLGGQEAPPGAPSVPGTPGGGPEGAGIITTISGFGVNNTLLVVKIKKGEPSQQRVMITNRGNTSLTINISITDLEKFVFPSEKSFILGPKESKNVLFNIYVSGLEKENLFNGKINFKSKTATISVDVILEATERAPLFDIKTTLLKKIFFMGQKTTANVKVLNLGDLKNIDVELESRIIDSKNKVYDSAKETFAINNSATKKVTLKLPNDISSGDYFFSSRVSYKNISATSYDAFKIMETAIQFGALVLYFVILIMVVLITLVSTILINQIKRR